MAEWLLVEELHIHVRLPPGLPEAVYTAAERTLTDADFLKALRQTIRALMQHYPPLVKARLKVAR